MHSGNEMEGDSSRKVKRTHSDSMADDRKQVVCVMSVYGPQTGRIEAEKEEFKYALERLMGLVEVMLCIAGDLKAPVGVSEPGVECWQTIRDSSSGGTDS